MLILQIITEKLYDTVLKRLKAAYAQVKIGDPLKGKVVIGPLFFKHKCILYSLHYLHVLV